MSFTSLTFSQEITDISKVPPLSKGKIILTDGTTFNFTQLKVLNDTVIFTNSQSSVCKYQSGEVFKILKTGNFAAVGAITSGLGGLLGGISGTSDWDNYEELRDKKTSFIVGATLVCAAIGGITGALIKKDKTIYKNQTAFGFNMGYNSIIENRPVVMLSCKINF
jgi:hypothetical protein